MKIWFRVIVGFAVFFILFSVIGGKSTDQKSLNSPHTVLIGLFTLPKKYERRMLVRTLYGQMSSPLARLYFVFCEPTDSIVKKVITAEKKLFKDIIILKCKENMDEGKTYSFFSSLPSLFKDSKFDFVMKTDDDVFLHIPNLVSKLSNLGSKGTYFGRIVNNYFMAGMGYVLSWDLVEWIANSDYANSHKIGQEDAVLASWLYNSGLLKHKVSDDNSFYDDPDSNQGWSKPYIPETILIHRLKDTDAFIKANVYFMESYLKF